MGSGELFNTTAMPTALTEAIRARRLGMMRRMMYGVFKASVVNE